MRITIVVLSLLILTLSIVSTTFVWLTLTSNSWSTQSYYTSSQNTQKWTSSVCTARRSPFYKCDVPKLTKNGTTGKSSCHFSSCQYYKPFGFDQTSCRLPVETGNPYSQIFIDNSQECQQVHYAGNLQIAASCFTTVALMLLLSLTSANVLEGLFIRSRGGNQEAGVFEAPDPRKKGTRKADSRDRGRDLTRTSSSLTRERALQMARDGSEEAERQRRRAAEGEATTMESEESQHRKREAQDGPAFADRLGETAIVRRPADENEKGGRRDCIPEEDDDRLRRQHRPHRSRRPKLSPYTPYVAASSVCLLCIGAALQVIAQFFGVLALTLNASPVPDDISNDTNGAFGANSWVIGVALSTYATVAWTTALITAGLVILTYRLPRIEKLL